MINGQHKRNRGIVKEINETCMHFREEINLRINELKGPEEGYE